MFLTIMVAQIGTPVGAWLLLLLQSPPSEPTTYELWVAALAILTTMGSAAVLYIPAHWGPWAKRAVVAAIAGALSLAGLYYEGKLDVTDWSRTWLLVFLGATALYTVLWRPASDALRGRAQT